jgi:hypothetical protein
VTRAFGYKALLKTIAAVGLPSALGDRLFGKDQASLSDAPAG